MEHVFEEVKQFMLNHLSMGAFDITMETCIDVDLPLQGGDGIEFILAYSKQFNVDVSRFMADDYFEAEGGGLVFSAKTRYGDPTDPTQKCLFVEDLVNGIIHHRLDEDIISKRTINIMKGFPKGYKW